MRRSQRSCQDSSWDHSRVKRNEAAERHSAPGLENTLHTVHNKVSRGFSKGWRMRHRNEESTLHVFLKVRSVGHRTVVAEAAHCSKPESIRKHFKSAVKLVSIFCSSIQNLGCLLNDIACPFRFRCVSVFVRSSGNSSLGHNDSMPREDGALAMDALDH